MNDINNYLRQNTPDYQYGEFIDRELSWIDFNYRVLECTHNKIYPINEVCSYRIDDKCFSLEPKYMREYIINFIKKYDR